MRPLYLVDGFNFLHAVVLKGRERAAWWSAEHQARVVAWVEAASAGGAHFEAIVVFDRGEGASVDVPAAGAVGAVAVEHAPDADAHILTRCAELSGTRQVVVVSADRSLIDRARRHGAERLSPWAFAAEWRAEARG